MSQPLMTAPADHVALIAAADRAARAIPPAWPLAATVAVNPFLSQAGDSLVAAGARLARVAGAPVTMPR
ncbi:putative inorganic carbon transporter subunit DabA, partial [Shewanella algae]|uniref:putative inorganic carbon transporter subunit DabA n=1 Tax=Shewanella algae TaxID=38313 RepID=UPI00313CDC41